MNTSNNFEKGRKSYPIGSLSKDKNWVKTADDWKPVKTHGHMVAKHFQSHVQENALVEPIVTEQQPLVEIVSLPQQPTQLTTQQLINIRNDKNKILSNIEEKLDDNHRNLIDLSSTELNQLREQKIILQHSINKLDLKIKNQKIEEVLNNNVIDDDDDNSNEPLDSVLSDEVSDDND